MALPDRRASPRERLRLPVEWEDGRRCWTRDISPDGVFVYVPGGGITKRWYALDIGYRKARLKFKALAQVMRIERGLSVTGVALRLHRQRFYTSG